MKAGDHTCCPHCGESTFVKEEVVMDGWTVKGKILICALCGKKLADVGATPAVGKDNSADQAKMSALSGLLGEKPAEKPKFDVTEAERHFCKDCINFIVHPFMTRCEKFDRDVDPMGDCPEFKKRPKTEGKE